MKKVIVCLALVAASAVYGAAELFQLVPHTTGTAVIAEKTEGGKVGGQAATLLPTSMTPEQGKLMNVAYTIAKADGHKNPEIVQSVLLQESGGGTAPNMRVANPGPEAYFGPMQLKLVAAKTVLSRWPALFTKYHFQTRTDDEIKANLILNDEFNIAVGSKYLLILQREYGFSGRELLNAYNRGPAGVREVGSDYHYARGAEAKLAAYKQRR
jgi:hypothetical protein